TRTLATPRVIHARPWEWRRMSSAGRQSMLRILTYLTRTPRLFQEITLTTIAYLARFRLSRRIFSLMETYVLVTPLREQRRPNETPQNWKPGQSVEDIARHIFSSHGCAMG